MSIAAYQGCLVGDKNKADTLGLLLGPGGLYEG